MSKSPGKTPNAHDEPPHKPAAVLVLGDIADTTWRMFVPSIGLTLAGWYIDGWLGTQPYGLAVGIVAGVIVAGLLIRQQLNRVNTT